MKLWMKIERGEQKTDGDELLIDHSDAHTLAGIAERFISETLGDAFGPMVLPGVLQARQEREVEVERVCLLRKELERTGKDLEEALRVSLMRADERAKWMAAAEEAKSLINSIESIVLKGRRSAGIRGLRIRIDRLRKAWPTTTRAVTIETRSIDSETANSGGDMHARMTIPRLR